MSLFAKVTTVLSSGALSREYQLVDEGLGRARPSAPAFDAAPYDPRAVVSAREAWRQRMALEHRSTAVFGGLALQLFEANASLDAKLVMLRMAQDELRHTATCADVVAALGGERSFEADLRVEPLAQHRGCPVEERALRNVLYTTCLSELVAVARLADELESTRDPFLRDATRRLLADELLHGQFGFHYLEAWRPWLEARPEVSRSLERYLRFAFAVLERELVPPNLRPHRLTEDELALGLTPHERGRAIFFDTMEQAVVPGLERFGLAAGEAFRDRAM